MDSAYEVLANATASWLPSAWLPPDRKKPRQGAGVEWSTIRWLLLPYPMSQQGLVHWADVM